MKEPIDIGKNIALANLVKYADCVETKDGNVYYHFPNWFEQIEGDFNFVIHRYMPEDLSEFITKEGLGGENPKRIRVKL